MPFPFSGGFFFWFLLLRRKEPNLLKVSMFQEIYSIKITCLISKFNKNQSHHSAFKIDFTQHFHCKILIKLHQIYRKCHFAKRFFCFCSDKCSLSLKTQLNLFEPLLVHTFMKRNNANILTQPFTVYLSLSKVDHVSCSVNLSSVSDHKKKQG